MPEIFHTIEHMFGLCGERHLSIFMVLSEVQNFDIILKFLKFKFLK